MTRRVRFTPLSCARTFVGASAFAWCCLGNASARAGEVPFSTQPPVSTGTPVVQAVALADVDGDGDLDALSASFQDDKIAWHENLGPSGWAQRTIALTADGAQDVGGADLDRDGDMDVLSASVIDNRVAWYENATGNGSAWLTHTISNAALGAWSVKSADVDGDGDPDVLAAAAAGTITWYENTMADGGAWVPRTITTDAPMATSVRAADVDGDGDQDALSASQADDKIAWYENTLGDGSVWVTRTISTGAEAARTVAAADVDGDGDQDAMASTADSLTWYENTAGNGTAWTARTMAPLADPWALAAGDIDGDGDLDALTAPGSSLTIVWLENATGNGAAWTVRTVATVGYGTFSVALGDLDGDGDPDLASAEANDGEVNWYRNESIHQTACFGPMRTIFEADQAFGTSAADIDRDGDLDVFATALGLDMVTWHRNEGSGAAWTAFTVAPRRESFELGVADVDGDGDPDALIGADINIPDPASWVRNEANGSSWSLQPVGTPGDPRVGLHAADIDGDGDADALGRTFFSQAITWDENQDGQGRLWARHTVVSAAPYSGMPQDVDLDRDGDLDVIVSSTPLVWHENVSGDGITWMPRTISATGAEGVAALDLDLDGDLDIVASNLVASPGILWHENLSGTGTVWAAHSLTTLPDFLPAVTRDVDRDGDLDLVGGRGFDGLAWLERTGPGVAFDLRTISTVAGDFPGTIGSPDLDGDGAPDVLWASQTQDAVRWRRNGRGQVVLDLLDQVPATVVNNDVFPVLRLTVTHGGRVGDSDLELARLGLLFEEEPGDPLTSAEANALVEELRVYRDADGNGAFDPGTDVLVTTVPKLALAAGVQTVPFADDDPNVRVAFGTAQTFFVVAQLTADASQQAPHQFRVTHLATGPSATQAEDRAADIPLSIACGADFPSRLIVATPVELMDFRVE